MKRIARGATGQAAVLAALALVGLCGADWPTWRYDAGRTASTPERLPEELKLCWSWQFPPLEPAFFQVRQERQQFDQGYEPVVSGGLLLVGSSRNDSLMALDVDSGDEVWRFYAEGPIRLAPAVWDGKVYFGSDDGHLYCLDLASGGLRWKLRASPSNRKVLGNGRLISAWPVRGGPVVAEGVVCFAAGVWPAEGIFVYAVDADTGTVRWVNDRSGSLYIEHPHGAMAFGGPSPMGYLLVDGDQILVPSGRAFPAAFDRQTGKLVDFAFGHGGHGSQPGGWFVASEGGELVVDSVINTEIHDAGQQIIGQHEAKRKPDEVLADHVRVGARTYRISEGTRRKISLGGQQYDFDAPPVPVDGEVHTMLVAGGKLFVVTRGGTISCFGPPSAEARVRRVEPRPLATAEDHWTAEAKKAVEHAPRKLGVALVWGLAGGRLVEELLRQTEYHVVAVDSDAAQVAALRRSLDEAGLYGARAAVYVGDPLEFGFPPYLADLVMSERPGLVADVSAGSIASALVNVLHPFGGAALLATTEQERQQMAAALGKLDAAGVALEQEGLHTVIVRRGALPGTADYTGEPNFDARVHLPLGLLWFGDTVHHHKLFYKTFQHEGGRGLPTELVVRQGVLKYAATDEPYGPNPPGVPYKDYLRLLEREKRYIETYTDIYTGRMFAPTELAGIEFPAAVETEVPPASTPPTVPAPRKNPITGIAEARAMLKMHGCDRDPVDYGNLLTYRSGTAAFYDKDLESGTVNIGGTRSGCRNSMVPAGGVLTLPSWTGNCTCNYPVFTSLALAPMPPEYEQWSACGEVAEEGPATRVGINFGAPGDRAAPDGTLWLDWPSVGGPSPEVPVAVEPSTAEPFYRHALWMENGDGWPWIAASGLRGARSIRIEPVVRRLQPPSPAISVCWSGAVRAERSETGTFHVESEGGVRLWIGDELLIDNSKNLRRGEAGEVSASMAMKSGMKYPIVLEYWQTLRSAPSAGKVRLCWSSESMAKCVVPAGAMISAEGKAGGLTALYYDHPSFSGPAVLRNDPQIDFAWETGRPEALVRATERAAARRSFTVRLHFAEPEDVRDGDRVFSVSLQGKEALRDFDIAREAGGPRRAIVREFKGVEVERSLQVDLVPATEKPPVICGIELIADSAAIRAGG